MAIIAWSASETNSQDEGWLLRLKALVRIITPFRPLAVSVSFKKEHLSVKDAEI